MDNRWTCKLSGFGLRNLLRGEQPLDTQDDNTRYTSEYGGGGCYEGLWSQEPAERGNNPSTFGTATPDTLVSMVVVAVVMAVIVFYQGLWSQESAACDTLDNTRYTSQYGGCVVVGGVCYKEGLVSGTCSAGVAYWHSGRP